MAKQSSPKTAIVKSSELGTNCWLATRFVEGGSRCKRVLHCTYPEKQTGLGTSLLYQKQWQNNGGVYEKEAITLRIKR